METVQGGAVKRGLRRAAHYVMAGLMLCAGVPLVEAETRGAGFHETFQTANRADWSIAHYTFSHPGFDTDWARDRVRWAQAGGAELTLLPKTTGDNRFEGGSMRRTETSHYGRYEVTMQPARGAGIITGFFTYSGPYYGTQHDEIDIEFLGKDTTKMHVAWFVDGELTNKFVDLGFDAADRPRRYAFEWEPDRIRWYAEDVLIFEADRSSGPLPQVPGYLFVNVWAADPSISNWSGLVAEGTSARVVVRDVTFTPFAAEVAAAGPELRGSAERSATTAPVALVSAE